MVRQTEIPFYRVFCALRVFLSDLLFKMVLCSCYQQNNQVKSSHKGPESRIETEEYTIRQLGLVFRHVGLQYMAKSVTVGVHSKNRDCHLTVFITLSHYIILCVGCLFIS